MMPRAIGVPQDEVAEHVVLRGFELGLARRLGLQPVDLAEDLLERAPVTAVRDVGDLRPGRRRGSRFETWEYGE